MTSLALLAGAKALAAAEDGSHAASDTQGRIVYMVLPEDRQESFWSNPPEFRPLVIWPQAGLRLKQRCST